MTRWGRASLVLILVAAPLGQAHAQRQSSSRNWVTLGLGQATWGGLTELGGQFTFSHQRGRMVVTGRGLVGFDLLGDVLQVPGMNTSVEDYGLMVGAGSRPGLIRYSLGAGVGAATITRKGSSGSADSHTKTFGVPLEGQLFLQPIPFVGLGFYGYGDLNKQKSFWGWSISVALGRGR
ncbi:MAG TPA: hypothetical protein VIV83_05850 [Gemmatimonadales bacterium]